MVITSNPPSSAAYQICKVQFHPIDPCDLEMEWLGVVRGSAITESLVEGLHSVHQVGNCCGGPCNVNNRLSEPIQWTFLFIQTSFDMQLGWGNAY